MGMDFDFRVGGQRRLHWGDFDSGLEWRSKWRSYPCGYLRKHLSRCAKALRQVSGVTVRKLVLKTHIKAVARMGWEWEVPILLSLRGHWDTMNIWLLIRVTWETSFEQKRNNLPYFIRCEFINGTGCCRPHSFVPSPKWPNMVPLK